MLVLKDTELIFKETRKAKQNDMTTAAGMPKEKMVRIFLNALIKHKLID